MCPSAHGEGHDAGESNRAKRAPKSTARRAVLEYAVLAAVAVGVALLVQAFLVKPYRIPSESMQDTLLNGDRVLVDRISWRFTEPQRGEIVVFRAPLSGHVLIKRLIGMPGDRISLHSGVVYVNGRRLDEPYVRMQHGRSESSEPFANGLPWSLQHPYEVPANTYFMMGDNRTNSVDSREIGPVPRANLVGRGFARYWPLGRIGSID